MNWRDEILAVVGKTVPADSGRPGSAIWSVRIVSSGLPMVEWTRRLEARDWLVETPRIQVSYRESSLSFARASSKTPRVFPGIEDGVLHAVQA
jgi:hypothetical protein